MVSDIKSKSALLHLQAIEPLSVDKTNHHVSHPQALVETGAAIGKRTRVWAFAHVVAGAIIGDDCNICDHTFIEGGVLIGNRVTVKCGVYLWNGLTVADDVFIGPAAVFTNDYRPRSQHYLANPLKTLLKEGCSIGANSTILPNLTVGRWAMVGAGAVVTRSVPDHALVVGNPARWQAWVCRCGEKLSPAAGLRLNCTCGRSYEKLDNGVKEVARVGRPQNGAANHMATNGHAKTNGS
jgi:UDP-2-acetamido-3-amino-2,3-dideoxy-glucuronate N-acetyltransferase